MDIQYLPSAYCVLTLLYFQPVLTKLTFMDEDAEGPTCEPLEEEGATQPGSGGAWAVPF